MTGNRPLADQERSLVRWMLEHGKPEARTFLDQLDRAEVTANVCPCGCASIDFSIDGQPTPRGGLNPIADFVFADSTDEYGAFVFSIDGVLAGLEVYGGSGEAPKFLPQPSALRPFPTG